MPNRPPSNKSPMHPPSGLLQRKMSQTAKCHQQIVNPTVGYRRRRSPNHHLAIVRAIFSMPLPTHENSLGLRTQPCRTPALMSNSRLVSCLVMIWPLCSQYIKRSAHTKCWETPCRSKPPHSESQLTRSKALLKSRLTIHKGTFANKVLSMIMFAVNKCSSILRPLLNPCCSSGWCCSSVASIRPNTKLSEDFVQ